MINWEDPKCKISEFFCVKEALWLPQWNFLHKPTEAEKANILAMAEKMDKVREIIGKPIKVHVWIRTAEYNELIGGAKKSAHIPGKAVDFSCGEDCDITRATILPHLSALNLRMENLPKSNWVHLGNDWSSGKRRYFKP